MALDKYYRDFNKKYCRPSIRYSLESLQDRLKLYNERLVRYHLFDLTEDLDTTKLHTDIDYEALNEVGYFTMTDLSLMEQIVRYGPEKVYKTLIH